MCSDVDRNDKSRVCEPGSVRVIGRRQIEMYSRLIHTVDHIEGRLRADMDAFDGFLSHAWAVTVTGAPKLWAMRFIEERREEPARLVRRGRRHGGLQRRHEHGADAAHGPHQGRHCRGARRRDAALRLRSRWRRSTRPSSRHPPCLRRCARQASPTWRASKRAVARVGEGVSILLVDHEDSFVHTLANYFRQTGASVTTMRSPVAAGGIRRIEARSRRAVARTRHAEGFRLRRHDQGGAARYAADLRRLPRAAGAGRSLWRAIAPARACRCTASRRASRS